MYDDILKEKTFEEIARENIIKEIKMFGKELVLGSVSEKEVESEKMYEENLKRWRDN